MGLFPTNGICERLPDPIRLKVCVLKAGSRGEAMRIWSRFKNSGTGY